MAVYFASDVHLGLNYRNSGARIVEQRFVKWLCTIEKDCQQLYLVGDIFDFWYEWKRVVPKGFVRLLSKLAQMCDNGIEIHFLAGNHDLWLGDYLQTEVGAIVHHTHVKTTIQGKRLFIAHGDNVGERDMMGRILSSTFRSRFARWAFSKFVHPNLAMRFGQWWSSSSRHSRVSLEHDFKGEDEYLVRFARTVDSIDYFVFGHLHTPIIYNLNAHSSVVVLGQWIHQPVYARMENGIIKLHEIND